MSSGSGILSASGTQFKNLTYDLQSKFTNLLTNEPWCIGLLLKPLRYHFGKYTLSLIGWRRRIANATRKATAKRMFIPAATPMSWNEAILSLWQTNWTSCQNRGIVKDKRDGANHNLYTMTCELKVLYTILKSNVLGI